MKIEVGKRYRTADGRVVKIIREDNHPVYPFDGNVEGDARRENKSWSRAGRYVSNMQNDLDLVEEVVMFKVGKRYRTIDGRVVKIVSDDNHKTFPLNGLFEYEIETARTAGWRRDGKFLNDETSSGADLKPGAIEDESARITEQDERLRLLKEALSDVRAHRNRLQQHLDEAISHGDRLSDLLATERFKVKELERDKLELLRGAEVVKCRTENQRLRDDLAGMTERLRGVQAERDDLDERHLVDVSTIASLQKMTLDLGVESGDRTVLCAYRNGKFLWVKEL